MSTLYCLARATDYAGVMPPLDYYAPAELYVVTGRHGRTFRRFTTAAEAIQFAVETLTPASLGGRHLVVDDERYIGIQICDLYASKSYPLKRKSSRM
jgi:hypothetical protein